MIKLKSALIKEVGSKDDVLLKILGVNNKGRVVINHDVAIEFRKLNFMWVDKVCRTCGSSKGKNA